MASTIDDADFILIDNFGGCVTDGANPSSWTTYSTTAAFDVGTKRAIYDDTNKGWATLMYLGIYGGTGYATGAAVKGICGLHAASAASGYSYILTLDGGDCLLNGPIAICLGTISFADASTTLYYGWFWVGGVCPVATISGLNGNYVTDNNPTAQKGMDLVDATTAAFGLLASSDVGVVSAFALNNDAA